MNLLLMTAMLSSTLGTNHQEFLTHRQPSVAGSAASFISDINNGMFASSASNQFSHFIYSSSQKGQEGICPSTYFVPIVPLSQFVSLAQMHL